MSKLDNLADREISIDDLETVAGGNWCNPCYPQRNHCNPNPCYTPRNKCDPNPCHRSRDCW